MSESASGESRELDSGAGFYVDDFGSVLYDEIYKEWEVFARG